MNVIHIKSIAFVAASVCLFFATRSWADYGEYARTILEQHGRLEFPSDKLPIVYRDTGLGRGAALAELAPKVNAWRSACDSYDLDEVAAARSTLGAVSFEPQSARRRMSTELSNAKLVESEDGTTLIAEGDYQLRVLGNGGAFRFINHRFSPDATNNMPFRLSEAEAEDWGRAFVEQYRLIAESELEQLRFLKTSYVHYTGRVRDPGDRVVSTRIHFGREIGGWPVIGYRASEIIIELTAGHAVHTLSVDWSPVELGDDNISILDPQGIERRFAGIIKDEKLTMEGDEQSQPIGILIRRRVCGYVDFGAGRSTATFMQPGCLLTHREGTSATPQVTFVPIGVDVWSQHEWHVTYEIDRVDDLWDDPRIELHVTVASELEHGSTQSGILHYDPNVPREPVGMGLREDER